ncbi:MAG: TIGR03086 family metal-binding protein [Stackebrandtia sp.]
MDHRQQYRQAQLDLVEVVKGLTDADLDRPTVCTEWTVRGVLRHLIENCYRGVADANGEEYDGNADPRLDNDPREEFPKAADAAWKVNQDEDRLHEIIDFAGMEQPAAVRLAFNFTDVLIHIWDIRRALGRPVALRPELVAEAIKVSELVPEGDEFRGPGKPFGHIVAIDSTEPQDKLLSLVGRDPAWAPAA